MIDDDILADLRHDPSKLLLVEDQSDYICNFAMMQNIEAFSYIHEPSIANCMQAVRISSDALKYIPASMQTMEIVKHAITRYTHAVVHVAELTEEICEFAANSNPFAMLYIPKEWHTTPVQLAAVRQYPAMFEACLNQTPELCWEAVQRRPQNLESLKEQTPELCDLALSLDSTCVRFIRSVTEKQCEDAVLYDGRAINFIPKKFRTDRLRMLAAMTRRG